MSGMPKLEIVINFRKYRLNQYPVVLLRERKLDMMVQVLD